MLETPPQNTNRKMLETEKDLTPYNTFGLHVKSKWFASYASTDELREVLNVYRKRCENRADDVWKVLHIGQGSNLLFLSDYEGLVLHSLMKDVVVLEETADSVRVSVGAGMVWDDFVKESVIRGWYGVENLTAIPGEVGAAAVQNIGAYGTEVKDVVWKVHCVDMVTLEERIFTCGEMEYAYRYSLLKSKQYWGRYAVTCVEFLLCKNFVPRLEYGALAAQAHAKAGERELTASMLREVIHEMRDAKLPDPKLLGNAGSFFMNPVLGRVEYEELLSRYPDMPHYDVDAIHVKVPAGWLIDKAGWKGKQMGCARVYERQALVLVNLGGATGADIVQLCEAVQKDVKEKFGITIRPEVNFIS